MNQLHWLSSLLDLLSKTTATYITLWPISFGLLMALIFSLVLSSENSRLVLVKNRYQMLLPFLMPIKLLGFAWLLMVASLPAIFYSASAADWLPGIVIFHGVVGGYLITRAKGARGVAVIISLCQLWLSIGAAVAAAELMSTLPQPAMVDAQQIVLARIFHGGSGIYAVAGKIV